MTSSDPPTTAAAAKRHWRLVRRGICRDVLLIGRWAVKVPTWRYGLYSWTRGWQANHSERAWSGVDGLAPVLWSLWSIVNVYPRCEVLTEYDGDYAAICPTWNPGDRKPDNLGLLDGRVVWIDYDGSWNGCPHSRLAHALTEGAATPRRSTWAG